MVEGPYLIGFAGLAGSGKSFAARALVECGFKRLRMADPLKDMLRALQLGDDQLDGDAKETPSPLICGKTPRHAMQTLGTEWGRHMIGPDLWLNAWTRRAHAALTDGHRVVVDDVRFINEIAKIDEYGGKVYWVQRDGVRQSSHISETLMPGAGHGILYNTGDDDFVGRLMKLVTI